MTIGAAVLSGCTTQAYLPPTPSDQASSVSAPPMTLQRSFNQSFDQTWDKLIAYAQREGITIKQQDKNTGNLVLALGTADPERYMDCGAIKVQQGSYTDYRQFLEYVTNQADTILNVTIDVKLKAQSATITNARVNAHYDLQVGGTANPYTGAVTAGTQYRFDSTGSTSVTMPRPAQGVFAYSSCQSTGVAEQQVLDAAGQP